MSRLIGLVAVMVVAIIAIIWIGSSERQNSDATEPPPLLENLGQLHHPISTRRPLAQRYFNQGLTYTFGFNHEAAVRSFRHAQRLDPTCAMCYWGEAYALGPNINAPMGPEAGAQAYRAATTANRLRAKLPPEEQLYIDTIIQRYAEDPNTDRAELDLAYANAMRKAYQSQPDDPDLATLFAESLMDLNPWNHWDADGQPVAETPEIVEVLEYVMSKNPLHPGANHYYIHAVEASKQPERALAAADRLADYAPAAGHLVHMPAHIYMRVGQYQDAVAANDRAAKSDEAYFAWCGRAGIYGALYYPHNVHFLWAAAATEGQSELALLSSRKLVAELKDADLEAFPFVEDFLATPLFSLVRFGRWDQILGEPKPAENLSFVRAIWHYARGFAFVRSDRNAEARTELDALNGFARSQEMGDLLFAGGSAASVLRIASYDLAAELAADEGDFDAALIALDRAIQIEDRLNYTEPPPWFFPMRQAKGRTLLQAGLADQAEQTYRDDLARVPRNGWSLFGLAESLRAQQKVEEAALVTAGFEEAWAPADVELTASRF